MKNIFRLTLSLTFAVVAMSSCSRVYTDASTEARSFEPITSTPITRPLTADIEMISSDHINDEWKFDLTPNKKLRQLRKPKDLPYEIKVKALSQSIGKCGADLIVAAMFDYDQKIVKKEYFGLYTKIVSNVITVKVTGYPAKYTDWRAASKCEDFEWIEFFYGDKYNFKANKKSQSPNINVSVNCDDKSEKKSEKK